MRFSIITVNYNNVSGLESTISSVINQRDYNNFEFIIIDGGSTDGSVDVIKKHAEQIEYWISEHDEGIYDAMNKGVSVAKGDYCIFMNSGDCFYDELVLHHVSERLENEPDFIAGNFSSNGIIKKAPAEITAMTLFKVIDKSICHQALFTKREILIKHPYQVEFRIIADFVNQFNSLVFDNASYQYVDIVICSVEPNGLSAVNFQRLADEKDYYLQKVLPERIYNDYRNFKAIKIIEYSDSNLYNLLQTTNFSKTDLSIAKSALKCVRFLKKFKFF